MSTARLYQVQKQRSQTGAENSHDVLQPYEPPESGKLGTITH